MSSRTYPLIGWGLATVAFLAFAVAVAEAYVLGHPSPFSLITALLLTGAAASWPFIHATQDAGSVRPTCRECGSIAWGFQEFHFCIHCGSTRMPTA